MSSSAPDELAWSSPTDQLAALEAKEVSSAELVELYVSRIDEHDTPLNEIVTLDVESARRTAADADVARSRSGGADLGREAGK